MDADLRLDGNTTTAEGDVFKTTANDRNAILTDGLPGLTVRFGSPPTVGIDHVEIVKGPASVLYGQAQPGGFVNNVTKKPRDDRETELGVRLDKGLSDYGRAGGGHTNGSPGIGPWVRSSTRAESRTDRVSTWLMPRGYDSSVRRGNAVTRARDGREPWHPEQRLDLRTALASSTDGRSLTLAVGAPADLAVLDVDPDDQVDAPGGLRAMPVAGTLLAGRWTHRTF